MKLDDLTFKSKSSVLQTSKNTDFNDSKVLSKKPKFSAIIRATKSEKFLSAEQTFKLNSAQKEKLQFRIGRLNDKSTPSSPNFGGLGMMDFKEFESNPSEHSETHEELCNIRSNSET